MDFQHLMSEARSRRPEPLGAAQGGAAAVQAMEGAPWQVSRPTPRRQGQGSAVVVPLTAQQSILVNRPAQACTSPDANNRG